MPGDIIGTDILFFMARLVIFYVCIISIPMIILYFFFPVYWLKIFWCLSLMTLFFICGGFFYLMGREINICVMVMFLLGAWQPIGFIIFNRKQNIFATKETPAQLMSVGKNLYFYVLFLIFLILGLLHLFQVAIGFIPISNDVALIIKSVFNFLKSICVALLYLLGLFVPVCLYIWNVCIYWVQCRMKKNSDT